MSRSNEGQSAAFRGDLLEHAIRDGFFSFAGFAREIGVSERTITRWRQGENPRPAHVRRLAEVLGRDPHEFYEHEERAA